MSSSSVATSTPLEIPKCGCNIPMRMFTSNTDENPKRRYWKCSNTGVDISCDFDSKAIASCQLFIWDDEIEGHPPYVRPLEHKPRNLKKYNDAGTYHGTKACDCSCSELTTELMTIVKDIQFNMGENMKMKLHNEKKKTK
ncbi:zinc finger homeodomain protein, partial [Trifolium medium]|nr:zinc finger homeodomain protein [Trifolium medium]